MKFSSGDFQVIVINEVKLLGLLAIPFAFPVVPLTMHNEPRGYGSI